MLKARIGAIYFSRLLENEDLLEAIKNRAEECKVSAGAFILIGALKKAVMGLYKAGEYKCIELDGPFEIGSCMGNIAVDEKGEVIIHAHLVVSNDKGEAFGGHLMKGSKVEPMAELMLFEAIGIDLRRSFDEKTKLKLLKLG